MAFVDGREHHAAVVVDELADARLARRLVLDEVDLRIVGQLDQAVGEALAEPALAEPPGERAGLRPEPLEQPGLRVGPGAEADADRARIHRHGGRVAVAGGYRRGPGDHDREPVRRQDDGRRRGRTALPPGLAVELGDVGLVHGCPPVRMERGHGAIVRASTGRRVAVSAPGGRAHRTRAADARSR